MSLINQMLHDLDRRSPRNTRSPGYVVAGLHSPRTAMRSLADKQQFSMGSMVLVGLLGMLLAAVVWRYTTILSSGSVENNSVSLDTNSETAIAATKSHADEEQFAAVVKQQEIRVTSLPELLNAGAQEPAPDIQEPPLPVLLAKVSMPVIESRGLPSAPLEIEQKTISKVQPAKVQSSFSRATVNNDNTQQPIRPLDRIKEKQNDISLKKKFRPLSDEQLAENNYKVALEKIQSGNISVGILELRNTLSRYPQHIKAREILAGLLIKAGQRSEATMLLTRGIEIHPQHSQYAKLYSRILLEEGDTQAALQVLEANRPVINNDPEYYATLAAVYQKLSHHKQAADIYSQLVAIQPGMGIFWMGLGISLEADGKPGQAVDAYQRAKQSGTLNADLMQFINGKITALRNVRANPAA